MLRGKVVVHVLEHICLINVHLMQSYIDKSVPPPSFNLTSEMQVLYYRSDGLFSDKNDIEGS